MTNKSEQGGQQPWWEKLTEASADSGKGKNLIVKALIVGIVAMAAYLGWQFFQKSSKGDEDQLAKALYEAATFIPDLEDVNFGRIPDPKGIQRSRYPVTLASSFYREHQPDAAGRNNPISVVMEADEAARYLDEVEQAIAQLDDQRGKFSEPAWELKFLHTMQQLHFYAGINCADPARRKSHFEKQKALLGELESKYAGQGLLGLKAFAGTEATTLDLWKESNTQGFASCEILARVGTLKIEPDAGVSATIELDNGKTLKVRFYSETSPKAAMNFVEHVRAGLYDGTAVHRLDAGAGVLEFGSVWSRDFPERKFIWGQENPGYTIPPEGTMLLPVKRGSITTKPVGIAGHGLFYEIHVSPPDRPNVAQAVIGEVTEGLEELDEWMQTGVHDEVGVAERLLPRTRLGIKKISVEGELQHPGDDSWKPRLRSMEAPSESALEKQFVEALKAAEKGPLDQDGAPPEEQDK